MPNSKLIIYQSALLQILHTQFLVMFTLLLYFCENHKYQILPISLFFGVWGQQAIPVDMAVVT